VFSWSCAWFELGAFGNVPGAIPDWAWHVLLEMQMGAVASVGRLHVTRVTTEAIGRQNAEEINAQLPIVTDPAITGYIQALGESIAKKTSRESPIDTDLFRAIDRAAHEREPGAFVTTPMETAATDRPTYRKVGITTYGFSPFRIPRPEIQRGMHGNDERLSVENVGYGVRFYYDMLRYAQ
jgi:acetylornithine deacetylase/succinyl-diaminopimelate desuccinylase-like protein